MASGAHPALCGPCHFPRRLCLQKGLLGKLVFWVPKPFLSFKQPLCPSPTKETQKQTAEALHENTVLGYQGRTWGTGLLGLGWLPLTSSLQNSLTLWESRPGREGSAEPAEAPSNSVRALQQASWVSTAGPQSRQGAPPGRNKTLKQGLVSRA